MIVVTGIGAIAPPGAIPAGEKGRTPFSVATPRRLDRAGALAIAAGRLAVEDAGLAPSERVGIVLGAGGSGTETTGQFFRVVVEKGPAAANPSLFPNTVPNSAAGQLAIALGAGGPNATFAARGVAAETAIAYAALLLERGRADAVLAGGVSEANEFLREGYLRTRSLAPDGVARPFDRDRRGLALLEGAGLLVLEPLERARARGARIYAAIAATAESNAETPSPNRYPRDGAGYARNVVLALERAGRAAARLGWVNAAANGTRALDQVEAKALALALGPDLARVPVSSVKGAAGDGMAQGGLRAVASCLAIAEGLVPATAGLETPDPALPQGLDLVRGEARERPVEAVLQTGFAEGGACVSIVFEKI